MSDERLNNGNREVHINETEASGGSKEGVVRWVLLGGLLLVIVLLSIIWITGALSQGEVESEATVSGTIDAMDAGEEGTVGTNTDSIIMQNEAIGDGEPNPEVPDVEQDVIPN
ncbi:hypothetical protein G7A66_05785 [Altererythrobacter sp. SALINAS58]|uniref:hypothetical protein n=1 Tax=Alteripontixanthobacter muriae TaxID=2705546 RepID=UPI00157618AA|nr:hypothetical protein [Alteripontixanthobacter muriae]NTZ42602.1 hypothetical protein [Alteripontixanthobacter muriae]